MNIDYPLLIDISNPVHNSHIIMWAAPTAFKLLWPTYVGSFSVGVYDQTDLKKVGHCQKNSINDRRMTDKNKQTNKQTNKTALSYFDYEA